MNQAKTAAAWSFVDNSNQASWVVSWLDDKTLQYKPGRRCCLAKPTRPSSRRGSQRGGTALATGPARNQDHGCAGGGTGVPGGWQRSVDIKSAITVIFNKPVVALMSLADQASLSSPISITPGVTGQRGMGQFLGVRIPAGFRAKQRHQLPGAGAQRPAGHAPAAAWGRTTSGASSPARQRSPISLSKIPAKPRIMTSILLNQTFVLTFNQAMDEKSVASRADGTQPGDPGQFSRPAVLAGWGYQPHC